MPAWPPLQRQRDKLACDEVTGGIGTGLLPAHGLGNKALFYRRDSIGRAHPHATDELFERMAATKQLFKAFHSSNHLHREAAKRMAINMPIQGTNAEMIKLAMIEIQKKIDSNKMISKMILQVHDELVFEVHQEELVTLKPMVITAMEKALPLTVPIVVDCGHGKSWYEAH